MYERILVPIDGSATAERGLDEAIGVARLTHAAVRLIHVLDEVPFVAGAEMAPVYSAVSIRRRAQRTSGCGRSPLHPHRRPGERHDDHQRLA